MKHSRRSFLSFGTAAGAAALSGVLPACGGKTPPQDSGASDGPAPTRPPEPEPWQPPAGWDADAFPFGLQSGDVLADGVLLSVRCRGVAAVTLQVLRAEGDGWALHEEIGPLEPDEEGVVAVELDGLEADTAYAWGAHDGEGRWSPPGRFRTALGPDGWRQVTIGATSCLGGNDPWPSLSQAAADRLDCFLLLGDTVYADGSRTIEQFRRVWRVALSTQGLIDVTASTSVVATWDDHEITNNTGWGTLPEASFAAGLQAFREALPMRGGGGRHGMWRSLSWGAVAELFVLDSRGERDGDAYLSREQLDWLKDGLLASEARFKLILNSVPITDETAFVGEAAADDRWQGYPAQREELLAHITDNAIEGIVWVSGDHHFAMVAHVDPEGGTGWNQWEVLVGPGGSFLNPAADLYVGDPQYPVMFATWNFTRFTCDPGTGSVRVEFVGDDGTILEEMSLQV